MHPGTRIRQLRERHRISRYALAKHSGVSLSFLNVLEREHKEPTVSTLQKICNALGVSLSDFFANDLPAPEIPPHIRELLETTKDLDPEQIERLTEFIKGLKSVK